MPGVKRPLPANGKKTCTRCKEERELSEYSRRHRGAHSLDSWCHICRSELAIAWRKDPANLAYDKERGKRDRLRLRAEVLAHYGNECACCQEARNEFLSIDHIAGGGTKHRIELGHQGRGISFYAWLKKQGYPEGFQVLCHNCNFAKGAYGVCPHKGELSRFTKKLTIFDFRKEQNDNV